MKKMEFYSVLLTAAICFNTYSPALIKAEILTEPTKTESAVSSEIITARKADLETLFKTLESKHPNIYNKNNQAVFKQKITEIESTLHTMNDFEFAISLCELTALIGDSHTQLSIGKQLGASARYIPINVTMVKEGLLITGIQEEYQQVLGGILTSINGIPIEEIKQKLVPMISFDNEVYFNRQFAGMFYVYEILEHYGVLSSPEKISLEIKLQDKVETIEVDALDSATMKEMKVTSLKYDQPETSVDSSKLYFFKALDDETLYIQYNACREDENLPMETFAEQVKETITQNGYKRTILDLRYNGGGSDGVIIPLMYVLDEKNEQEGMRLYTLIGSNTFSSALINAVELKEIGSVIVGSPTGGSVDHFGEISGFELPNSKIKGQYSNELFELDTLLESAKPYGVESFLPDIAAEQTREDYLLGKDTALQAVLSDTRRAVAVNTELTRAVLAVQLGRDYMMRTGNTMDSVQPLFDDVSMVSYYTPYIAWASKNHLMNGKSEGTFAPNQVLTRSEVAVVLMRYAEFLGASLKDLPKDVVAIEDISTVQAWEEEAVKTLGGTEVFPLIDGKFQPKAHVTCKAFDELFKSFKKLIELK